jgi:hypothetical protein
LQGARSVDSIVNGNAVQAAITGCPQSSECCPPSVGILSALRRIPHRCAGLNDDRPALRAPEFVNFVVPDLQNMKVFRSEYRAATLRGNLQSRG